MQSFPECRCIRPYLNSGMDVLELACGSGQLSLPLAERAGSWTATDFSEKMIDQAKKRGGPANLSFSVADATALPYKNERFDCIVIANALHIMPKPEKAMQEILRVLKPGGILYAPTFLWAEGKPNGLRRRLMALTGFQAYREWNRANFQNFVAGYSFNVMEMHMVDGGLAPVGALVATKTENERE